MQLKVLKILKLSKTYQFKDQGKVASYFELLFQEIQTLR